jgi:hypothetical protein
MNVIIALFGEDNFAWSTCKSEHQVVTIIDVAMFDYWMRGDRQGSLTMLLSTLGPHVEIGCLSRPRRGGSIWVHG